MPNNLQMRPEAFGPEFADNLLAHGAAIHHVHTLMLPGILHTGDKSSVPYSFLSSNGGGDPFAAGTVFYVPGLSENPTSNAPFGVTLANADFNVVLPGHPTGPTDRNPAGKRDALWTRAQQYRELLDVRVKPFVKEVDYVTHSMGNLVLQKMMEQAIEDGDDTFLGATVVMLAPSGVSDSDSLLKLGVRNYKNIKLETGKDRGPQEFNDDTGEAAKSCNIAMAARPLRTLREVRELAKKSGFSPDPFIRAGVARVALVGHANDPMYTDDHIVGAFEQFAEAGMDVSYWNPVKIGADHMSATHNDEQANPSRVGPTVVSFLRHTDRRFAA